MENIVNLSAVSLADLDSVGGKNASTGEMLQHLLKLGVKVPAGFATTTHAYKQFLSEAKITSEMDALLQDVKEKPIDALTETSQKIQSLIINAPFLPGFIREVKTAYAPYQHLAVAVRSSATTEDLVTASFAGAQDTFLNVRGLKQLLHAIKLVYASLFTARAIAYREDHGVDHSLSAISVGIQPMVRSDKGVSGVMFTLDTESGFDKVILINGSYGLGEAIVQGKVNPDEFIVYKPALCENKFPILQRKLGSKSLKMIYGKSQEPTKTIKTIAVSAAQRQQFCLSDEEIIKLSQQALLIEKHYGNPMDIEWAKDGLTNELYILQARPETVASRANKEQTLEHYTLQEKGKVIISGQSIGQRIGSGKACIIQDPTKSKSIEAGDVLVTDMTDPDWEPIMKIASAIVTNRGGRTCHAAIVARELGIPALVGCGNATDVIKESQSITVSCAEGQMGYVYEGELSYECQKIAVKNMPDIPVKLCINMANPDKAFITQRLPNDGVGLARLEFIISHFIGIHPNAVLQWDRLPSALQKQITKRTAAYASPLEFYIEKLREGVSMLAAAFYPKDVIFRFSDFKSNEYANLLGGSLFEPVEDNPMLGFRGASRYRAESFRQAFELECKAMIRVREKMGLSNTQLMIPFVRTVNELKVVMEMIERYGLRRGANGLKIYMMCEIPSNILLASKFLEYVDGFSIGSNDLTQLTLGLDRDSNLIAEQFDERDEAVKILLSNAISACVRAGKYVGICGQAPSDYPDLAFWLVQEGISAISLNSDTIVETWLMLAKKNQVGHKPVPLVS